MRIIRWAREILRLLQSIDQRLERMEKVANRLDGALSSSNHRNQMCLKIGHWNDPI